MPSPQDKVAAVTGDGGRTVLVTSGTVVVDKGARASQ